MTDIKRLEQAFIDIESLENNWNSYGAKKPSEKTLLVAKNLCFIHLPYFCKSIEIEPTADGSILLEVKIKVEDVEE